MTSTRLSSGCAVFVICFLANGALAEPKSWTERVKISGSADLGFFGGGPQSVQSQDGFYIWDARLFVDAELGEDLELASLPAIRNLGFTFEWNIARNGSAANDVGLAYLDLEGIAQSNWINLRVGRFQIPFGEAYKLYSKGYANRTFVQQPIGGPWWWDEGALLHGTAANQQFGYLASITNGDTEFNAVGDTIQLTGKLWAQPFKILYVSASGLWTNKLGEHDGALWLGEGWARPFGSGDPSSNWIDDASLPDDPDGLGNTWALALDAVVTPLDGVRIWLAGGRYDIQSKGSGLYDRALWYWITEVVVGGQVAMPALRPLFLGIRVDGVGTWDENRGYLLDVRYTGVFGYNMESMIAYTAVAGWKLGDYVTLRAEYSHRDVELVRGAASGVPASTGNEDVYSVEFGLHF